jgi:hypothetical protein
LNFWPDDIVDGDSSTPIEILNLAKKEFEKKSNNKLTLVTQEVCSETSNNVILKVHVQGLIDVRSVQLFNVVHRPDDAYPAKFQLREAELPTFLQSALKPWVASSPAEFRKILKDAFAINSIKPDIIRLLAMQNQKEAQPSPQEQK